MTREVRIGKLSVGSKFPLVLIAGPCVIESEESALLHAQRIKEISSCLGIPFIFKSSYDKANRTSFDSFRGPGLKKGLKILKHIKQKLRVPVLSDVHCVEEIDAASKVLDILQIPALLCRQTNLILKTAQTGKPVNIKKGQFMAPWDMGEVIRKVESTDNRNILITERGTSFGYNNLVSDLRALGLMRNFGYPVIYDATHSLQLPGAMGRSSGGQREFVCAMSRAAVAFGCEGLFIEVHDKPDEALCDGPNMITLNELEVLLAQVKEIEKVRKG